MIDRDVEEAIAAHHRKRAFFEAGGRVATYNSRRAKVVIIHHPDYIREQRERNNPR